MQRKNEFELVNAALDGNLTKVQELFFKSSELYQQQALIQAIHQQNFHKDGEEIVKFLLMKVTLNDQVREQIVPYIVHNFEQLCFVLPKGSILSLEARQLAICNCFVKTSHMEEQSKSLRYLLDFDHISGDWSNIINDALQKWLS